MCRNEKETKVLILQSHPPLRAFSTPILDHGRFTALSAVKGTANERLQDILKIRDRRLLQAHGSNHRMQSVCDSIPTTLPSDLESVGYHKQCHQRFTAHLDRWKDDTNDAEEEASTSGQHHSPRKSTLVGSHVQLFPPDTGEDCTSAFKGKGKVGPLKKLEKNPRFHMAFRQLGDDWDVEPRVAKQLEQFTCMIYNHSRESSVYVTHGKLLRKMVGENEKFTSKSKVDCLHASLPICSNATHSGRKPSRCPVQACS